MAKDLNNIKAHVAMLTAEVMWGLNAPVAKIVLAAGITPLFLNDCRMIGAACLFWLASFFTQKEHVDKRDMIRIFLAALLGIILNQGMFLFGVRLTSPVNASIISTISPILTMVMAAIFLHEPITRKKVGGVALGAIGAILLITNSAHVSGASGNIIGDILCILAQTCYSCYLVFFKGLTAKYSPITLMKWMFTYSALCVMPFTYQEFVNFNISSIENSIGGGIIFIVAGATFLSYLLLPVGQKRLRPTIISSYNYVQPVVASIVAIAWGLDNFNTLKIIAIALIFTGVFLVTKSRSRAQMDAASRQN